MKQREDYRFTTALSRILLGGVVLTLVAEIVGIIAYFVQTMSFQADYSSQWQLTGTNFFDYLWRNFLGFTFLQSPMGIMALGVAILILTPYLRVVVSAVYFAETKNRKYLAFTTFVLLVVTSTLLFL